MTFATHKLNLMCGRPSALASGEGSPEVGLRPSIIVLPAILSVSVKFVPTPLIAMQLYRQAIMSHVRQQHGCATWGHGGSSVSQRQVAAGSSVAAVPGQTVAPSDALKKTSIVETGKRALMIQVVLVRCHIKKRLISAIIVRQRCGPDDCSRSCCTLLQLVMSVQY